MKASELRVGSLVDYEGAVHTVYEIQTNLCRSYRNKNNAEMYLHGYSEIKPIPLTEEWLTKLGFDGCNWIDAGALGFQYLPYEKCVTLIYSESVSVPNIQFVHQLQNLYFALTGEELK